MIEVGKIYGGYFVVEKLSNNTFKCICKCGKEFVKNTSKIITNKHGCKSCSAEKIHPGTRFGRLVVNSFAGSKNQLLMYNCVCDCGQEKVVAGVYLRKGSIKSCGCLQKDTASETRYSHGQSRTGSSGKKSPVYQSWQSMKRRCNNSKCLEYKYYGGRGISYDKRWECFEEFYKDMGDRPKGTSLDRIDVNKNYYKENCRWAGRREQSLNSRKKKNSFSKYKGVHFDKARSVWVAKSRVNGKTTYLGSFNSEVDAAKFYDKSIFERYGTHIGTNSSLGLL